MAEHKRTELSDKTKKIIAAASLAVFVILMLVLAWVVGRPLLRYVQEPEKFREWVDSAGFMGRVYFLGIQVLQVVIALIPGEPVEIGAGYAFGAVEGTVLCVLGSVLGSMAVYFFVRRFGIRAVEIFFPVEKIEQLRFLNTAKKRDVLMFVLMFIPGTPKDLLGYFAPLAGVSPLAWLFITSVARIPSIVTSTVGGGALGGENYGFAVAAFAVTLVISGVGLLIHRRICVVHARREAEKEDGRDG